MSYPLPTAAEIKSCYPEFANATDGVVNQKIAEAASEISATTWGAMYTRGVMLYTAHLLCMTPEAIKMRLKDGTSTYWARFQNLKRVVSLGKARVAY